MNYEKLCIGGPLHGKQEDSPPSLPAGKGYYQITQIGGTSVFAWHPPKFCKHCARTIYDASFGGFHEGYVHSESGSPFCMTTKATPADEETV